MMQLIFEYVRRTARPLLGGAVFLSGNAILAGEEVSIASILRPLEERNTVAESAPPERTGREADRGSGERRLVLTRSEVVEDLEIHLQRRLGNEGDLSLRSTDKWPALEIPAGSAWKAVTDDEFHPDNRGRWAPVVTVLVDGEPEFSRRLSVTAALHREVLITRQRLERGEVPRTPVVGTVVRDVFLERGNPIPADEDLADYVAVRSLGEGQLLSWADITRRPLVKRGDVVDVSVEKGALRIRMRAQCLENGAKGEIVTLRNLQSRREFQGLVEGANLVRVAM